MSLLLEVLYLLHTFVTNCFLAQFPLNPSTATHDCSWATFVKMRVLLTLCLWWVRSVVCPWILRFFIRISRAEKKSPMRTSPPSPASICRSWDHSASAKATNPRSLQFCNKEVAFFNGLYFWNSFSAIELQWRFQIVSAPCRFVSVERNFIWMESKWHSLYRHSQQQSVRSPLKCSKIKPD